LHLCKSNQDPPARPAPLTRALVFRRLLGMERDLVAVCIDDDEAGLLAVERMGREAGLEVMGFSHPREAVGYVQTNEVDVVFVDSVMPRDGVDVVVKIRERLPDIPIVLLISEEDDEELKRKAISEGVTDFLRKPLSWSEFTARVRAVVQQIKSQHFFKDWSRLLEKEVEKAAQKALERENETIRVLGMASEYKDPVAANHVSRVAHFCRILAKSAGEKEFQQDLVFKSSPLHDLGKLGIPESILFKPGRLTDAEFEIMKTHTTIGFRIIKDSANPLLQTGSTIALTHHERWDGSGYPKGLRAMEIPLFGRIAAVADVFDALISKRPFREAWSLEKAFDYIESGKDRHFDPRLASLFLESRPAVQEVCYTYRDPG
jgi:response regulator RpfG family c-di-GMP phosphodiesterase